MQVILLFGNRSALGGAVLTHAEAASLLADYAGAADPDLAAADAAEVRRVFSAALVDNPDLPASWYDVWDRVSALEGRGGIAGGYDFRPVYRLLNVAVNTWSVPFPRDVG